MIKDRSTDTEKYALVVSIDNLDRCPHRNIVKVLEAVHLLLERDEVRRSDREARRTTQNLRNQLCKQMHKYTLLSNMSLTHQVET